MNDTNAFHTHKAKGWTETKKPADRNFVLDVKLVLLKGAIVPDAHHNHENNGKGNRDPCTFKEFDEGGREEEHLYGSKECNKAYSEQDALVPAQDNH